MGLKSNIEYWKLSLENREPLLDEYYLFDDVIVNDENLISKVKRLRELIICYCILIEKNESNTEAILEEILNIIKSIEKIQYTEFVAFWKVFDISYSVFKNLGFPKDILIEILNNYCNKRKKLYDQLGYTNITIQALYDSGVSRKKGSIGIIKIIKLIKDYFNNVIEVKNYQDILNNDICFFLPDENKSLWEEFKSKLGLRYYFGATHENKIPDIVLKIKYSSVDKFFIIEAKHIKETGGAQDKQINETIMFISYSEDLDNIHYISFLDGIYFNKFIDNNRSDKIENQMNNIIQALEKNKKNFYVNTSGLKQILIDLKS